MKRAVHVAAAALFDACDRVLIAQRPPGKRQAGGWEFPGGKVEAGETRIAALARELREELGVEIESPRPLMRVPHTYTFGDVLIDMWVVRRYRGEPRGLDGQPLRWCTLDELETVDLLTADLPIVAALRLPERLTERQGAAYELVEMDQRRAPFAELEPPRSGRSLLGARCTSVAQAKAVAAARGADFIVMDALLDDAQLARLCEGLNQPVYALGIALEHAWTLGASGVADLAH